MVPSLQIKEDPRRDIDDADFGVTIAGNLLLVPSELFAALQKRGLQGAEDFISFLHLSPSTIASDLLWSLDAVLIARRGIIAKLRGYVAADILDPSSPRDSQRKVIPPRRTR